MVIVAKFRGEHIHIGKVPTLLLEKTKEGTSKWKLNPDLIWRNGEQFL